MSKYRCLRFCDLFSRNVTAQYTRVSPGAGPTHYHQSGVHTIAFHKQINQEMVGVFLLQGALVSDTRKMFQKIKGGGMATHPSKLHPQQSAEPMGPRKHSLMSARLHQFLFLF
jgi:hypothetical protein